MAKRRRLLTIMSDTPVKIAIAGLGGYAHNITDLVLDTGPQVSPKVEVAAVCDPCLEDHPSRVNDLRDLGITVVRTFDEIVAIDEVEGVWLPVPINLHVPFAKQALAAGKSVMVEKPVAGTVDELDELREAEKRYQRPVLVGFQDVYDSTTIPLKRRLLSGELGEIRRATLYGCWPRNTAYFTRNNWAGAIRRGDTWVLDSPVNNAMAHFLNITLFLMGQTEADSALPVGIEAELYRAAEIENYDTASIRVGLDSGSDCLVLLTHACRDYIDPVMEIHTDRGVVRRTKDMVEVCLDGQPVESIQRDQRMRTDMLEVFGRVTRGMALTDRAVASLGVARAHTLVVNGASQACAIREVPESFVTVHHSGSEAVSCIPDIADSFKRCAASGQMLHEAGCYDFTQPADRLDLRGYKTFAGPPTASNASS